MKNLIWIFVLTLLQIHRLAAQEAPAPRFHKNVFVEGMGNGIMVSVNYDMRLKRGIQDGPGARCGIGGGSFNARTEDGHTVNIGIVSFPLEVNYLVGQRRSSFEAGVGITPVYVNANALFADTNFFSGRGWGAVGFLNAGYRYQPLRKGIMFRVNWTPAFSQSGFEAVHFGISLGIGFK